MASHISLSSQHRRERERESVVKTPVVLEEVNSPRCAAPPAQAVGEGQPHFRPIRPKRKIACTRKNHLHAHSRRCGAGAGFVRVLSRFVHPSVFPQTPPPMIKNIPARCYQSWGRRPCYHVMPTTTFSVLRHRRLYPFIFIYIQL